jgi:signal transduction histidine kinase
VCSSAAGLSFRPLRPQTPTVLAVEEMRRTIQRGLAAFRWLAWGWMAAVLVLARGNLVAPWSAAALVGLAGLVTVWLTWQLVTTPERLVGARAVGIEVGVGVTLQLADGFVYASPHVFTTQQPLGVAWPIAGVLAAGVALGPGVGAVTGLLLGLARAVSSILNVAPAPEPWIGPLAPDQGLSLLTTTVLYVLAGGIAGHATRLLSRAEERLMRAERSLAALEAREDVARRLHDGVLQTLAIVERRAEDPDLARLARDQERDLRRYLLDPVPEPLGGSAPAGGPGPASGAPPGLGRALRASGDRAERWHGVRTDVLVPDDLPPLPSEVVDALAGAVGEALTNVGKHAQASRVVVYAEPQDGEVFVSVRDDGLGYDPASVAEGLGLTRSIRGRVAAIGGRVEVATAPGKGVEVRLWAPVDAR